MDKVAQHNNGVKHLFMAVDVLSRYLRLQPLKSFYAKDAVEAFKKPEKVWTDKGSEFKRDFKKYREKKRIHLYATESETKSAFAEKNNWLLKNIIYKNLEKEWTWRKI